MADIDKGLPNTKLPIPGAGEIADVAVEEIQEKGRIKESEMSDTKKELRIQMNALQTKAIKDRR